MTWIVGRTVLVGYAMALSDVRVTFADGSERDCLRKIHQVHRSIALGFAGSVQIGFAMVERLAGLLSQAPPGMGWDPAKVAAWWPEDAREIFDRFPEGERRLRSHMLLLGAHPSQGHPFPTPYIFRFRDPEFAPEGPAEPEGVLSIGSGETVPHYVSVMAGLSAHEDEFLKLEAAMSGRGGVALALSNLLTRELEGHPAPGISRHLHICAVRRDGVSIGTNDRRWIGEPESTHFVMPAVASSMRQLDEMLSADGLQATGLQC